MSMDQLLDEIRAFDGVLELAPTEGSTYPELTWGDHFFYYAPDDEVPQRTQPYATVVTKDYPGDTSSRLDPPDRWRLNVHVGRSALVDLVGDDPADGVDHAAVDVVLPHPVYRAQGWIAIVNPDVRTRALAVDLLAAAHDAARRRATRRA